MAYTAPPTKNPGDLINASDWNIFVRDNQNSLGIWQTWVPQLTADSVNPGLGSTGSARGRYARHGSTIVWRATVTAGGTGVSPGAGFWRLSLPVPAVADQIVGNGYAVLSGAYILLSMHNTFALVTASGAPIAAPAGWVSGSTFAITGTYEAA